MWPNVGCVCVCVCGVSDSPMYWCSRLVGVSRNTIPLSHRTCPCASWCSLLSGVGHRFRLRRSCVPFVTGTYCDINPLYLANTSCTYSCSGCSERCLSWVDLEVNCCWSVPILYIKKFPPTHPGEVDCRPPLAVWCVFASAIEQYSPSQKDSVRRA